MGKDEGIFKIKPIGKGGQVVIVLAAVSQNFTVGLVHPVIEPVHGLDGHVGVNVHIHRSHAAEASGDVERDIIARATAGHPWPCAIGKLHFAESTLRALGF